MLVLSRAKDQTVKIGDDIQVTIVSVRGGKVKLGIVAPKSVRVDRLEVAEARRVAEGLVKA